MKFATYTRDSSTGLDYADQRYYGNTLGRFITADPSRGSAGPSDPRNWNRYAYTRGDPVNRLDAGGLDDTPADLGPPIASVTVTSTSIPPDVKFSDYPGGPGVVTSPLTIQAGDTSTGIVIDVLAATWAQTLADLLHAAGFIAGDGLVDENENCANDIAAITGRPGTVKAGQHISAADIAAKAGSVQFMNILTDRDPALPDVNLNSPDVGVGPSTYAITLTGAGGIGSTREYWRPGATVNQPGTGIPMTPERLYGMVMHELLHNLGFTDKDIQYSLGLPEDENTDSISTRLTTDCFK